MGGAPSARKATPKMAICFEIAIFEAQSPLAAETGPPPLRLRRATNANSSLEIHEA
jgi:hypothetical protein